jgi:hypothetical protein
MHAVSNARTQVYTSGVNNGFRIQVPADQTRRAFRLYLGVWNRIECAAAFSDGSTAVYSLTQATIGEPQREIMHSRSGPTRRQPTS